MQPTRLVLAAVVATALLAGTQEVLRAQASGPGITATPSAAPVQPQPLPAATQPAATAEGENFEKLTLTAGRSMVLASAFDITRLAVTNPAIADATAVAQREVLIDGKAPGTISLILWGPGGARKQYDVVVDAGVPILQQQLSALFPGEDIHVSVNEEALILSGSVSSNQVALRAGELAGASSGKFKIINMLQLPGGNESQQVMLQVRFAEVNRRALLELGTSLFLARSNVLARTSTGQFPSVDFNDNPQPGGNTGSSGSLVFSDFLNIFFLQRNQGWGVLVKALQQKGYFQSLAEPNLIAYNGQEASFLAGGEFPVPFVSGNAGTVSVQFKEFGVRLRFKPTIAGDVIRLKVAPEVSSLDFNNGVTISGFRIPALTTRRAETDVELRDGQSFAIAGLLNNISQTDSAAIPLLSRLPIIGYLFKTKADRAERTELMVLITPRLVRPLDPDEVPPLPTNSRPFLPGYDPGAPPKPSGGGTVDAPPPPPAPQQ